MEASRLSASPAHGLQVLSRIRELLYSIVGGTDPNTILPVHAQRDRAAHARSTVLVRWGRPKPTGLGTLAAPEREQIPLRRELLDAIERGVRRIDVAGTIEGNELRPGEPPPCRLAAAELPRLLAV